MRYYRRCMTLLEVLIAMGLSMVLISIVVYFYQQLSLINLEMDKAQNEHFQKRYVEYRLNAILPEIVSPTNKDFHFFIGQNNQGLFNEGSQNLVFTYNNGVKLDKKMSDLVIGRLYLDKNDRFSLASWPIPKRWKEDEAPPITKEVIMENVVTLSFSFYAPPDKGQFKFVNKQEGTTTTQLSKPSYPSTIKNETQNEWKREYRQLPAIIYVKIKRKLGKDKFEDIVFAYPLPNTQQPIIYTD